MSDTTEQIPEWAWKQAEGAVFAVWPDMEPRQRKTVREWLVCDAIARAIAAVDNSATERAADIVWNMRKPFVLHGREIEAEILAKAEAAIRKGMEDDT